MSRKIYMNVAEGDECRIAVLEDGKLYEFFIDRPSQLKHVGNIYKGIINNIEPGIQAAFVDVGLERNGFLHVSDVNYAYQNNSDVKKLYSKTIRIKEAVPEKDLLTERHDQDVEEVDDFVGDGSQPHEAAHGADEAAFLEKLDEEHPGHQVTESPLAVETESKEAAPAQPSNETKQEQATEPKPESERKRRRPRRRRRKPATSETKPETPNAEAKPESAPAKKEEAPAEPAKSDARPVEAEKPAAEPVKETPPEKAAEEKSAPAKRKRRRTPKLRGGKLPKRVTDEVEKTPDDGKETAVKPTPTESKPPEPKPDAGANSKDIDGQGGGEGPIPGPNYRYHRGPQPKIQALLKRGQEVVVQVTKASQGGKGPGLSTFVSLPGRYMVLTPNSDRGGVSRKIEDGGARNELRKMLDRLPVPEGMGVIVRTAAINRSFEDLQRDLNYLVRVWSVISERIHDSEAPALLYTDSDPAIRTVRDYFTADTTEIVVDDKDVYERVLAFFDQLMPSFRDRVKLYEGDVPLFFHTSLENQLDHIFDKKVNLKSGGYLFVEQTEALISIDVNSGKFTSAGDAEKTAYQTNMEAIPEICRQLRLRDLGGIVCCDLIDMSSAKHRSDVEHALRRELRRDRARTKVAKMSPFGVIELTRQRVRPSIKNYTYVSCPTCAGFGMVRSAETMCLSLIRRLKVALIEERVTELAVQVHPHVLSHLHSEFRDDIDDLEDTTGKRIVFEYAKDLVLGQARFFYVNDRGGRVLYDMDQRINSFVSGNAPKAKTNVPMPLTASGAASPAVAEARKEGKSRRRRRGGRRQREREQERQAREARIKSDAEKAVTFGDKLPAPNVEVVKEKPKEEGKSRRRGRRGGRKVREREAAKSGTTDAPKSESPSSRRESGRSRTASSETAKPSPAEKKPASGRKSGTATKTASKTPTKASSTNTPAKKPASGRKAAAATRSAAKPKTPAGKTAAAKPTAKKGAGTKKASSAKKTATKTVAKSAAKKTTKAAPKKTPVKKTAAKKTPAKKPAAKKTPVKKAAVKKATVKKPAAKKPAAKKATTRKK
ncbi:MAG: Rne/Rng family ribonuclease [Planctomycetes bacterium]|nr:Rne/Rng family ribonuclease [Planctomycetota bacterium]